MIHMKCQVLFSLKTNNKNRMPNATTLCRALRIKWAIKKKEAWFKKKKKRYVLKVHFVTWLAISAPFFNRSKTCTPMYFNFCHTDTFCHTDKKRSVQLHRDFPSVCTHTLQNLWNCELIHWQFLSNWQKVQSPKNVYDEDGIRTNAGRPHGLAVHRTHCRICEIVSWFTGNFFPICKRSKVQKILRRGWDSNPRGETPMD